MRSKSCLKVSPLPSRSATPDSDATPRKCVTWCSHMLEEVFEADDWDRTPHEPSKHLSYSETLELKSIQRSLPYADQPPDPLTGKPGASRLNKVPLTLLPLLPAESSPPPMSPPPSACSQSPSHMLSPTPTSPPNTRKFNIAFTPLMPSSSPCSENFPHSSPEPSVQHAPIATNPPERKKRVFEINGMEFEMDDDEDSDQSKDVVRPPLTPPSTPQPGHSSLTSPSPQSVTRRKKVIMVNDMEIELSDDESDPGFDSEDDDDNDTVSSYTTSSTPFSSPPQTPPQQLNSIAEDSSTPKNVLDSIEAPVTKVKPRFQFVPLC